MKGCEPLTNDEMKSMLPFLNERDSVIMTLGAYTGFRISEILSLKIKDCYLDGRIRDRVYLQRQNTKGKIESRQQILHQRIQNALQHYIQTINRNPDAYLFPSPRDHHRSITRNQVWANIRAAARSAGITKKLGTHCLRKTFAWKVYRSSNDLRYVQAALGHKTIQSTIQYLNLDSKEVDQVVSELT